MQHSTLLRKSTVQSNVPLNSLNPIIRLRLRLRLRPQTHLASLMTRFQSTSSPSHVASSPALNLLSVSRVKPPHVNWTYGEFLTMPEWMGFTSMTCCWRVGRYLYVFMCLYVHMYIFLCLLSFVYKRVYISQWLYAMLFIIVGYDGRLPLLSSAPLHMEYDTYL